MQIMWLFFFFLNMHTSGIIWEENNDMPKHGLFEVIDIFEALKVALDIPQLSFWGPCFNA